MGIIMKTCGHCGRSVPIWLRVGDKCPHCGVVFEYERGGSGSGGRDWGAFFKLLLIVALVGTALLVPLMYANRPKPGSIAHLRQQLSSPDPWNRLQAGRLLAQKGKALVGPLAADYAQALRNADPETRTALILNLADVEMALRRDRANFQPPLLPGNLVIALEEAKNDEAPDVRAAAEKTLAAISAR